LAKIAASYARYSTDLQNETSVADQQLLNNQIGSRFDHTIPPELAFSDHAKSSDGILERPGLQALLRALKERKCEAVIVEDLHRISRDPGDMMYINDCMKYAEAQFINIHGPVPDIMVYLRGLIGFFQLQDVKNTIRRQRNARNYEGLVPGPFTYGYRNKKDGRRGEREIYWPEAHIVTRIFNEYADGKSPLQIVMDLNAESIPCPSARMPKRKAAGWSISIFKGRGCIISNPIYIGLVVWNRFRRVKHPDTEKKQPRLNDATNIKTTEVPALRIIDQEVWDRCQARKASGAKGRQTGQRRSAHEKETLLRGKFVCSSCGGQMIVIKSPSVNLRAAASQMRMRIACSNSAHRAACSHRRSYYLDTLEDGVLDFVKNRASNPGFVERILKGAMAENEEQAKRTKPELETARRDRDKTIYLIDRIDAAILESDEPIPVLIERRKKLKTLLIGHQERVNFLESSIANVALHSETIKTMCGDLANIHAAITDASLGPDEVEPFKVRLRNYFDRIVVYPVEKRADYVFEPAFRLATKLNPKKAQENQCTKSSDTCSIPGGTVSSRQPLLEQIFTLGQWRQAA